MNFILFYSGLFCAVSIVIGAEDGVKVGEIDSPNFAASENLSPERVIYVLISERDQLRKERGRSRMFWLNPSDPLSGFREVFKGPGENHYARFVTPLFNGWGIVNGSFDELKRDVDREIVWFNLFTGKKGNRIGQGYSEYLDGEFLIYQYNDYFYRYHLASGELYRCSPKIEFCRRISNNAWIGLAISGQEAGIVEINPGKLEVSPLGKLPEGVMFPKRVFGGIDISYAGDEGLFLIYGFDLWFRPRDGTWRKVVENVPVRKTFGGVMPSLPVKYMGDGKFAVAKTVNKEIAKRAEKIFPEAVSITMLIDGYEGKVLDQSEEVIYDHNPPLTIPERWEAGQEKDTDTTSESLFQWDAATKVISSGDWLSFQVDKKDQFRISACRQYLATYRRWSSNWDDENSGLPVRLFDSRQKRVFELKIESNFETSFFNRFTWIQSEGSEITGDALGRFRRGRLDPFRDPWR